MTLRLSSRLTLVYKVFFPSAMTVGAATMVRGAIGMTEQLPAMVALLAAAALLVFFSWKWNGGFKTVRAEDDVLVIGNYLRSIRVPLSEIDTVTDRPYININPVTITFRQATPFGSRIHFMAPVWWVPFESHPNVRRLKRASQTGAPLI